jgi:hypothetical protein
MQARFVIEIVVAADLIAIIMESVSAAVLTTVNVKQEQCSENLAD